MPDGAIWPFGDIPLSALISAGAALAALVSLLQELTRRGIIGGTRREIDEPLETKLTGALAALEKNSREAIELLGHLQAEITRRAKGIEDVEARLVELRHQRTLLELSHEQKRALQLLTQPKKTVRDIVTSLDFWVGRVLPSTVFFILGLIASALRG